MAATYITPFNRSWWQRSENWLLILGVVTSLSVMAFGALFALSFFAPIPLTPVLAAFSTTLASSGLSFAWAVVIIVAAAALGFSGASLSAGLLGNHKADAEGARFTNTVLPGPQQQSVGGLLADTLPADLSRVNRGGGSNVVDFFTKAGAAPAPASASAPAPAPARKGLDAIADVLDDAARPAPAGSMLKASATASGGTVIANPLHGIGSTTGTDVMNWGTASTSAVARAPAAAAERRIKSSIFGSNSALARADAPPVPVAAPREHRSPSPTGPAGTH